MCFQSDFDFTELYKNTKENLRQEAQEKNRIYDPKFEEMLAERINKLDDFSVKEFYRIRSERKFDENQTLSNQKLDMLLLESMEKSFFAQQKHQKNISCINIHDAIKVKKCFVTLTPYEIKLLDYINGRSATNISFPGYFTHQFQLDLNKSIKRLFMGEYVELADISYTIRKAKNSDLKNFSSIYSLKKTGNKNDLIRRIFENISEKEIYSFFSERYFSITEKGQNLIEENQHIFFAHNYHNQLGISIDEIYSFRKNSNNSDYHQDFIEIIFERVKNNVSQECWGLYRNNLYALSLVYKDMKNYLLQSVFLLYVYYYDLECEINSPYLHSIDDIAINLSKKYFTIDELEMSFKKYNFDVFPCNKRTKDELFTDVINIINTKLKQIFTNRSIT